MPSRDIRPTTWLDVDCLERPLREAVRATLEQVVNDRTVACLLLASRDGRWPPTAMRGRLVVVRADHRDRAAHHPRHDGAGAESCGLDDVERLADILAAPHVLLVDFDRTYLSMLDRVRGSV